MRIKNPTLIKGRRARWLIYTVVIVVLVTELGSRSVSYAEDNGFDLSDTLVPRENIHHGGPDRDGIPAIDRPRFIKARHASFLKHDDRVLGLALGKVVRAYPIRILNYHEIVNDTIDQRAVVVSYCPLCGSGMAFTPELNDNNNSFGVSGLLYNSDMLLYDRHTESLWSQIMGTAISGKLKGKKLTAVALTDTTWAGWLKRYPETEVLSTRTGYFRNYDRHPYGDYDANRAVYYPVSNSSGRYHPKQRVVGLSLGDQSKAYPIVELAKQKKARFTDVFAGKTLTIEYDAASRSAVIYDAQQRLLPSTTLFWFAWVAFHPQTEVYQ